MSEPRLSGVIITLRRIAPQTTRVMNCRTTQPIRRDPHGPAGERLCSDHDAVLRGYFLTAPGVA